MRNPRRRKPRFRRVPNPDPLQLTERDFRILALVSEHRFLQSHHLVSLVSGSEQHLIRRLGRLYHAGLLDRPDHQKQIALSPRDTFAYCLTERGRKTLQKSGLPVFRSIPRLRSAGSAFSLAHDLLVSETVVTIRKFADARGVPFRWHHAELSIGPANSDGRIRAMRWSVSLTLRGSSQRCFVIPDAAFCLEFEKGSPSWFFLEFDRGTMPVSRSDPRQSSFLGKIQAYKETRRAETLWKRDAIPGFRVLVVTESEARLRSLQTGTATCFDRGESRMFLFKTLKALLDAEDPGGSSWETCSGERAFLSPF